MPELLVVLLLAREQPAHALQPLQGLRTHSVLEINLGLQDKVFKDRGLGFRSINVGWRCCGRLSRSAHGRRRRGRGSSLARGLETSCDGVIHARADMPLQSLESLRMPRLVGIEIGGAIQCVSRAGIVSI